MSCIISDDKSDVQFSFEPSVLFSDCFYSLFAAFQQVEHDMPWHNVPYIYSG